MIVLIMFVIIVIFLIIIIAIILLIFFIVKITIITVIIFVVSLCVWLVATGLWFHKSIKSSCNIKPTRHKWHNTFWVTKKKQHQFCYCRENSIDNVAAQKERKKANKTPGWFPSCFWISFANQPQHEIARENSAIVRVEEPQTGAAYRVMTLSLSLKEDLGLKWTTTRHIIPNIHWKATYLIENPYFRDNRTSQLVAALRELLQITI